jgi:hypothetical protein
VTDPSPDGSGLPPRAAFATSLVLLTAAIKLALHVTVNLRTPYGLHRDELPYLGMGRHFRLWGAGDVAGGEKLIHCSRSSPRTLH